MKKIIILLLLLLFPSAVMSEMITGGVEYTASEAQDIILQDKPKPVNAGVLRNKYLDCDRDENIQNMLIELWHIFPMEVMELCIKIIL